MTVLLCIFVSSFFFFYLTSTTLIYTLSLHDAPPIFCVSRAMKVIGEVQDFRPAALVRFVFRAMRVGWMWVVISMMTLAFFSLLRSEEHTSELQSRSDLVCRLLLEKKKKRLRT